jgi:hypothetical protein
MQTAEVQPLALTLSCYSKEREDGLTFVKKLNQKTVMRRRMLEALDTYKHLFHHCMISKQK